MNTFCARLAGWICDQRLWLLALAVTLSVPAIWYAADTRIDNSLEVWFRGDDSALAAYRSFVDRFGGDEVIVAAIDDPGGFATDHNRQRLTELVDTLAELDDVARVTAITTVPRRFAKVRARLLSADGKTTGVLVRPFTAMGADSQRSRLLSALRDALDASGFDYQLAGVGVLYDALDRLSTRGIAGIAVAVQLLMAALLWLGFRRWQPMLVTLSASVLASTWLLGLHAAMGYRLNLVTMILPTLVQAVTVVHCIHLMRAIARQPATAPRVERVRRGIAAILAPCVIATLTTAGAFAALAWSSLEVVRTLGLFAALGVMIALPVALVACAIAASLDNGEPAPVRADWLGGLAVALTRESLRRPRAVLATLVLLLVLAVAGSLRLSVDTFSLGYLYPEHPVRADADRIESRLGATVPLDFVVHAPGRALHPAVLRAVARWQRDAEHHAAISGSWSLATLLEQDRSNANPRTILDTHESAAKVLDTHESADDFVGVQSIASVRELRRILPGALDALVHREDELRVTLWAPMLSAAAYGRLLDELVALNPEPDVIRVHAAGYMPLYVAMVDYLQRSQIVSFMVALMVVIVILAAVFRGRSARVSLAAANVLPPLLTLGAMGWLGIPVDLATVTIAAILIGLVTDDTVHVLWTWRSGCPSSKATTTCMRTAQRTGSALLLTTLVLAGGFALLGIADIRSVVWFGGLLAFALTVAAIVDLTVLPVIHLLGTRPVGISAWHAATAARPDPAQAP